MSSSHKHNQMPRLPKHLLHKQKILVQLPVQRHKLKILLPYKVLKGLLLIQHQIQLLLFQIVKIPLLQLIHHLPQIHLLKHLPLKISLLNSNKLQLLILQQIQPRHSKLSLNNRPPQIITILRQAPQTLRTQLMLVLNNQQPILMQIQPQILILVLNNKLQLVLTQQAHNQQAQRHRLKRTTPKSVRPILIPALILNQITPQLVFLKIILPRKQKINHQLHKNKILQAHLLPQMTQLKLIQIQIATPSKTLPSLTLKNLNNSKLITQQHQQALIINSQLSKRLILKHKLRQTPTLTLILTLPLILIKLKITLNNSNHWIIQQQKTLQVINLPAKIKHLDRKLKLTKILKTQLLILAQIQIPPQIPTPILKHKLKVMIRHQLQIIKPPLIKVQRLNKAQILTQIQTQTLVITQILILITTLTLIPLQIIQSKRTQTLKQIQDHQRAPTLLKLQTNKILTPILTQTRRQMKKQTQQQINCNKIRLIRLNLTLKTRELRLRIRNNSNKIRILIQMPTLIQLILILSQTTILTLTLTLQSQALMLTLITIHNQIQTQKQIQTPRLTQTQPLTLAQTQTQILTNNHLQINPRLILAKTPQLVLIQLTTNSLKTRMIQPLIQNQTMLMTRIRIKRALNGG